MGDWFAVFENEASTCLCSINHVESRKSQMARLGVYYFVGTSEIVLMQCGMESPFCDVFTCLLTATENRLDSC